MSIGQVRRFWYVAAAIAVCVLLAAAGGRDDVSTKSHKLQSTPIGTYAVGRHVQDFVDTTRPTPANGSYPGAPSRTLHTTVYYPARGKPSGTVTEDARPDPAHAPYPLIVLAHGSDSFGQEFEPLLRQWASAGYVAAAPDFPLSKKNAPGGQTITDLGQQPGDMSVVIGRVLELANRRRGLLAGLVDSKRVGAAGHSLGGVTTFDLVDRTCCADRRVKAAVTMAGAAGTPPQFFQGITTPLLVLQGDADGTIPYQSGVSAFEAANPPKFFVTLIGGMHTPPYRGAGDPIAVAVTRASIDFFDRYLKGDPDGIKRLERDAGTPGVAKLQEQPA